MMVLEHEQVVSSYQKHHEESQKLKQQRAQTNIEYEACLLYTSRCV